MYSDYCDDTKARICGRIMGRGREVGKTAGNRTDDSSKKVLLIGCSSTTSGIVLRAEMAMYPLKTSRDVRELKWQYKVRNLPKKRLPAIVDRVVLYRRK